VVSNEASKGKASTLNTNYFRLFVPRLFAGPQLWLVLEYKRMSCWLAATVGASGTLPVVQIAGRRRKYQLLLLLLLRL